MIKLSLLLFVFILEFERAAGSEQVKFIFKKFYFVYFNILKERLISTVIIDPPFSQNSFIITDRQFVPTVLNIAQVNIFFALKYSIN